MFDGGPFVGVEVVEPGFDAGDQPPDPVDLFVGGCGLLPCPVVELGAGEEAFAVAEQVVEVGVEVGEVGDVGAEVVTACAAESERAGPAPGSDVRRLGADAVGDSDFAQGPPCVFGVDKGLRFLPDPVPVPVDGEGGNTVDGFAAAGLADAVVALGGVELAVVHQLAEHLDGDSGVGVALGVAVPVGVEDDPPLVELCAVDVPERRLVFDPLAVLERQAEGGDGAAPVGVAPVGGKELQVAGAGERVAGPDVLLLGDDHFGGGLADGKAAAETVGFVVVEDEHGAAVVVTDQAFVGEVADLLWPSAGVDGELDGAAHHR